MAHTRDISTITLYIILGILATILLLPVCIRGIYNFKLYSIKKNIIRDNDEISSVDILADEGIGRFRLETLLRFKDNTYLILDNFNGFDKGSVRVVNGFRFFIYGRRTNGFFHTADLPFGFIAEKMNININSINDIIKNRDKIFTFIGGLDDITSEKFAEVNIQSEWVWDTVLDITIGHYKESDYVIFKIKNNDEGL